MGEDGRRADDHPGALVLFALVYAVSFVLGGLAVYALARGLAPVGGLSWEVVTAYSVGYAASILAFFIPGGLGAREAAIATALSAAMPFRVALAVAIGSRLSDRDRQARLRRRDGGAREAAGDIACHDRRASRLARGATRRGPSGRPASQALSVIVPVYRSALLLEALVERLGPVLEEIAPKGYEIILVNDGSPDDSSWAVDRRARRRRPGPRHST